MGSLKPPVSSGTLQGKRNSDSSLEWYVSQKRERFQQLFFPDGIVFDGKAFVRTALTAPAFNWLEPAEPAKKSLVDLTGIEPVTS